MSNPRKLLADMRVGTFEHVPYLASYIYAMKEHEKPGIKTMSVDQHGNMYWDPQFVSSISKQEGAYCVTHEVLHLIFKHHERARLLIGQKPNEMQKFVSNVAADLVIEQALEMMRHLRPEGAVHLGQFIPQFNFALDFPPDLRYEEYYRLIMDRLNPDDEQGESEQGQPQSQQGGEQGDGEGDGQPQQSQAPAPDQSGKPSTPGCGGSCADGQPREYEEPSDGEWESFGEDIAAEMAEQAIEQYEKTRGSVPGAIKTAIGGKLRPVSDPWSQLRSAVATSVAAPVGGRESTYRRVSRKQHPDMMRLRGSYYTQPSAVVVLDTSGSMCNGDDQAKALSCIAAGLRKLARFKVICGDTRIASRKDVSAIKQVDWAGGGGTDMAAILERVDKEDRPDSIVLVTDCETGWPARATRARVVVACTSTSDSAFNQVPRWCRKVRLTTKQ
jgi:predicted metal-dependent peptidase